MGTMALQQTAPIGTSILHLLGAPCHPSRCSTQANGDSTNTALAAERPSATAAGTTNRTTKHPGPSLPCILLPPPPNGEKGQADSKRILLQGPSKSGRTSMAMNLAYSCALSDLKDSEEIPCHCLLQPCRCTSVILYRKAQGSPFGGNRSTESEHDDFPLPCRYAGVSESGTGRGLTYPYNRQATNTSASFSNTVAMRGDDTRDEWNPQVLRRIRIRYVECTRDILQDLLGTLAKSLHDHPSRAIIIDDLDEICGSKLVQNERFLDTQTTTSIMQTMAVAVDTSHALQELHGILPYVVATMSSASKITAPWMDTIVSLTTSDNGITTGESFPHRNQDIYSTATLGRGTANFHRMSNSKIVVDYTFRCHPFDGTIIEWDVQSEL